MTEASGSLRGFPDWFTGGYAEAAFRRHLLPLAGRPGLRFLQIGAYAGDASVWLAENVLTGPGSVLVDVDTWQGSIEPEHALIDFDEVRTTYIQRIRGLPVNAFVGTSDAFRSFPCPPFDFIYVDGAHTSEQVLRDAVQADYRLRDEGLLAFDDYKWGAGMRSAPSVAIDAFLRCFEDRYEVLERDLQVWVRKVAW